MSSVPSKAWLRSCNFYYVITSYLVSISHNLNLSLMERFCLTWVESDEQAVGVRWAMPVGARWAMPCSIWMLYDESVFEVYVHKNQNIGIDVSLLKLAITLSSLLPSLIIKFAVCKFSSAAKFQRIILCCELYFIAQLSEKKSAVTMNYVAFLYFLWLQWI